MLRALRLACVVLVAVLSAETANPQTRSVMTRHVREAVRSGRAKRVGKVPGSQVLKLNIVLPLRDQAGLETLLKNLYDPSSRSYRHFLTVRQFTEQFGPTQKNYDAVVHFAKSNHLTVIGGSRDGMNVEVTARASAIESAFHVTLRTYRHPTENRNFYAPDKEPTTELAFSLWHVSGLDNYSIPHALFVRKSDYAKAHGMRPQDVVSYATTGSGPSSSFLGSDMRAAYYGGTALTGEAESRIV
jgi:subtilase family serine protease